MAEALLKRARITGLATVVGSERKRLDDEVAQFGGDRAQIERLKKSIGLNERWVVPASVTAVDMGEQAARQLLADAAVAPTQVDALIFVTQTPDHFQPCNAAILHGHLGLPTTTAAFDVNLGCSGFVYGLYLASLMVENGGCQRVLLVAGDTLSHTVNARDRSVAPLFGDAAAAALVEAIPAGEADSPSWFSLQADGRGSDTIKQPAGAFREPVTSAALEEHADAEGNVRTRANLRMMGADVFTFTLREVPPAVEALLQRAQLQPTQVDAYLFHQANRYVISNIARRLRLPLDRVPMDMVEHYGNQSSASIPATACAVLGPRLQAGSMRLVLAGFGVGLSWATACVAWGPLRACSLNHFAK